MHLYVLSLAGPRAIDKMLRMEHAHLESLSVASTSRLVQVGPFWLKSDA